VRLRGFPAGNKPVSKTRKGGGGRPFVVALADAILKGRQPHRRSGNGFPLRRTFFRRPDHRRHCRRLPVWRSDPAQRSDFASQIKAGLPRASALSPRRPINRRIVFFPAAAGRICKQIKKCCAIQQYLTPFGTGGCGGQRGDMAHGTIFVSVPHMGQRGIDVCGKRAVYISQLAGMKRAVFSLSSSSRPAAVSPAFRLLSLWPHACPFRLACRRNPLFRHRTSHERLTAHLTSP
jgi:hypothetical protein